MSADEAKGAEQATDPASYARAILNILGDFSEEKTQFRDAQKAILNILEDSGADKLNQEAAQNATLNILEDAASERARLEATQKAVLNILEDFDAEKNKVEHTNRQMAAEIAERRQTEEALRQAKAAADALNKELEAFAYSVSHDLRQPLRAIDGFCDALYEDYQDKLDETGKRFLGQVRAGARRMAQLIDELLQLSRVTRAEFQRQAVDLTSVAEKIAGELQQGEPARRVAVRIAQGLRADTDPRMVDVLLRNLLGNAWKFTGKQEHARIEFGVENDRPQPAFFVRDNGAGFDMKYAHKLFGAFQRLHSGAEFAGNGIGLATAQRIVLKLGGTIWADAKPNEGATFYFTL